MKLRNIFYIISVGAGLLACSSASYISASANSISVIEVDATNNRIDSIISPYRLEIEQEMNEVIGRATVDYVANRPNSRLNNWAADALLNRFRTQYLSLPVVSLLNVGGLRSTFNTGEITLGDVFKMMPFDNEVVAVRMPRESLKEIAAYLIASGGEPISGMRLENGVLNFNEDVASDSFIVLTSDYLYNGGDKMNFFHQAIEVNYLKVLLRDVFVDAVKTQLELQIDDTERIILK